MKPWKDFGYHMMYRDEKKNQWILTDFLLLDSDFTEVLVLGRHAARRHPSISVSMCIKPGCDCYFCVHL